MPQRTLYLEVLLFSKAFAHANDFSVNLFSNVLHSILLQAHFINAKHTAEKLYCCEFTATS